MTTIRLRKRNMDRRREQLPVVKMSRTADTTMRQVLQTLMEESEVKIQQRIQNGPLTTQEFADYSSDMIYMRRTLETLKHKIADDQQCDDLQQVNTTLITRIQELVKERNDLQRYQHQTQEQQRRALTITEIIQQCSKYDPGMVESLDSDIARLVNVTVQNAKAITSNMRHGGTHQHVQMAEFIRMIGKGLGFRVKIENDFHSVEAMIEAEARDRHEAHLQQRELIRHTLQFEANRLQEQTRRMREIDTYDFRKHQKNDSCTITSKQAQLKVIVAPTRKDAEGNNLLRGQAKTKSCEELSTIDPTIGTSTKEISQREELNLADILETFPNLEDSSLGKHLVETDKISSFQSKTPAQWIEEHTQPMQQSAPLCEHPPKVAANEEVETGRSTIRQQFLVHEVTPNHAEIPASVVEIITETQEPATYDMLQEMHQQEGVLSDSTM